MAASALIHSVTAVMNSANLHKTAQTGFLHQDHHVTKTDLVPGLNTPTPKGTDNTPPTMGTDMGEILANNNHTTILTATGTAAATEGTHHVPHPVTAATTL